ncbi:MAG: HAD-IB family hydrolase, partial [Clostridium sp.]
YGDTSGDFSMFTLVGNPVCINATRELLDKVITDDIVKEKARIIVERKDVIYKLSPNELHL